MFFKPFLTALAAAAILGSAAHAADAPSRSDVVSKTVFIGDLNLANPTGARVALQRIEAAATAICGEAPDLRLLDRTARYHACMHDVVGRAVASVDSPIMTAMRAPQGLGELASDR